MPRPRALLLGGLCAAGLGLAARAAVTPPLPLEPAALGIPDAQQAIDKTTEFYLGQGVLGGTIILLLLLLALSWVIIWRLAALVLKDRDRMVTVMEALRINGERDREVLRELSQSVTARTGLIPELVNQQALLVGEIRHGFGNYTHAASALAQVLRTMRLKPAQASDDDDKEGTSLRLPGGAP